ncbi:MAG: protease complex subunit PrcB family protein [Gammaproteobacteria bacterium]|nr:protease complex subunit PrcB family protein [Gammaproteobacteria bacterium]
MAGLRRGVLGLAALSVVFGCAAPRSETPLELSLNRLRPDSATYTLASGFETAGQFVARDRATWQVLWQQVNAPHLPAPALPVIDFDREMVLVVAMGRQASGGHSLRFERVARDGEGIVVTIRREQPGSGCIVPSALTFPVDIATVPRSSGPVAFKFESATRDCR